MILYITPHFITESFPSYSSLATRAAEAIITIHMTAPNPLQDPIVVASDGLAVVELLLGGLVVVPLGSNVAAPPVGTEEVKVEVAVVGRFESAASVVYTADKPVTFEQILGAAMVPATKFTAAHYGIGISIMISRSMPVSNPAST